jgi:hypothetical protein
VTRDAQEVSTKSMIERKMMRKRARLGKRRRFIYGTLT